MKTYISLFLFKNANINIIKKYIYNFSVYIVSNIKKLN